ncbi:hypothetical protein B0T17DRAFT_530561 [Bombardia bombarda]|uniref:AAA+ ATPase domain-containing protein n=1 Tax=Bombardia bombarda TaxID=252184 RepID=A0AA39WZN7_9PEZI|nr:hypothetical protein B0T17DRAFT_530561 [Bombardia bombarda]
MAPRHQPMKTTIVDWRGELCRFLDIPAESTDDQVFEGLEAASAKLAEAERLKKQSLHHKGPPVHVVINRVSCQDTGEDGLYLDAPWMVESGPYNAHLRVSQRIRNLEVYLERNKDVSFIVYRDYECCGNAIVPPPPFQQGRGDTDAAAQISLFLKKESITIHADELRSALGEVARSVLASIPNPLSRDEEGAISHPYLWWFHKQDEIRAVEDSLHNTKPGEHLGVLREYVYDRMKQDWQTVEALTARGKINARFIEYLFFPREILVSGINGKSRSDIQAFIATEWLKTHFNELGHFSAEVDVEAWGFDGNFEMFESHLPIQKLPSYIKEFDISHLEVYPMKFAPKEEVHNLRSRGKMFWKCRRQRYVCYSSNSKFEEVPNSTDARFMVDIATYKQMHPDTPNTEQQHNSDALGTEIMNQEEPDLGDEFYMCLPTSIYGFNMQKKEWVSLEVGRMEDVEWNTEAFNLLVIDKETKELVQAVVTNQLNAEENTDLIRGKGNGLFILLHGGPGTGKTLTAESVAEIARKPLYRVTCGDIGTKAEDVEKYLEVVLLLGKTWGCVVLLDEADVFLEQRTINNMERNALVSVFLRVLEYYDGILILTSNRVGTFDEAFKSRIQLNLRYKNLDEDQRLQIWDNFITRLEKLLEKPPPRASKTALTSPFANRNTSLLSLGVNTKEIRDNMKTLAKPNLNGREIRNAISTARQLAMYRQQPLGYEHLRCVIDEAKKFDDYLTEVHEGFTAEEMQRERGER